QLVALEFIHPARVVNEGVGAPGSEQYSFRHALLREAAYGMLTDVDRQVGHRLAAEWLSARRLEHEASATSLSLAEHFERGQLTARAVPHYRAAAEQALDGGDLELAIHCAERGIACGAATRSLGELRLLQATAHRWRGHFEEAQASAL